jgi:hypothetical protein
MNVRHLLQASSGSGMHNPFEKKYRGQRQPVFPVQQLTLQKFADYVRYQVYQGA